MRIWTTCGAATIVFSSLVGWSGVGMAATPQVTGHRGFTLALSANGELRSWGSNHFGDLGDGSTQQREQPLVIGTGYRQVRASGSGIFGLKDDGSLWAWGDGQLGLGSSSSVQVPTLVGTAFKDVVPGFGCHYGIKTDNTLWGWGTNANGELGDGGNADRTRPVQLGADFAAVVSGTGSNTQAVPIICYTLALKNNGEVWTWGSNAFGQLGNGTTSPRNTPSLVGTGFREVKVGVNAAYGIQQDGTLWSWGDNTYGQLGDGSTTQKSTPVQVATDVAAVFPVGATVFAIKTDGSLWAWGNNAQGQLGDGSMEMRTAPVRIGSGFTRIDRLSDWSVYGLQADGSLWAWGSNLDGEMGDGTHTSHTTPTRIGAGYYSVTGLSGWAGSYTVALKTDGSLWAWGDNASGNLGDGTTQWRLTPVAVLTEGFAPTDTPPQPPTPAVSSLATFNGATGLLDLPRVELSEDAYHVKLLLVDPNQLSFRVTALDPAVAGRDANTVTLDAFLNIRIPRLQLGDQTYWVALRLSDASNLTLALAGFGLLLP